MRTKVNLETWIRTEHFNFFKVFSEPFWGLQAEVNMGKAKLTAKQKGYSLFSYYLHCALRAACDIENFGYRIESGEVYHYAEIGASATVAREDGLFGFTHMPFHANYSEFNKGVQAEMQRVRTTKGPLLQVPCPENVMHVSTIPWVKFTGLSHARHFPLEDSVPKMTFGKLYEENGEWKMPVSMHVHHALMDGLHVGQFFERFQYYLDQ